MNFVWLMLIMAPVLLYSYIIKPRICKKMIYTQISNLGGQVYEIEELTLREYLYCVYYTVDGESKKAIVRFNIFYETTWK